MQRTRHVRAQENPTVRVYDDDKCRQANALALLGHSDADIARVLGVSSRTFAYWMQTRADFRTAVSAGRDAADARVAESLFKLATGYEYEEEQVIVYRGRVVFQGVVRKYAHASAYAAKHWLTMRSRERWSDTRHIDITQNVNIRKLDLSNVSDEELKLIEQIQAKQLTEHVSNN